MEKPSTPIYMLSILEPQIARRKENGNTLTLNSKMWERKHQSKTFYFLSAVDFQESCNYCDSMKLKYIKEHTWLAKRNEIELHVDILSQINAIQNRHD